MATATAFLPKLFRWAFTILTGLAALGALGICVVLLVNPHMPQGTHFGPIALDIGGQPGTLELRPSGNDSDLLASLFKGSITFAVSQAGGFVEVMKHYGLPLVLLRATFLVALFELLRRLFRNVGRGESFSPDTIRLVQFVGGLMIVFSFVLSFAEALFATEVYSYLANHAVITVSGAALHLPQPGLQMFSHAHGFASGNPPVFVHAHGFPFDGSLFFSGLLVLALSEVFRQGLALKKDGELTI